jgi:Transmembrane Fragile-X-F protein
MGFVQRALFTWFVLLVFLILLCLRLEQRILWNWFIVFLPFWFYDTILIIWVVIEIIKLRSRSLERFLPCRSYQFYLGGILLKIVGQILLCLKLEYDYLNLYLVMIPIWALLLTLIVYVGFHLQPKERNTSRTQKQRQQSS